MKECYFKSQWRDMGAVIPCCNFNPTTDDPKFWMISDKSCLNCPNYFPKNEAPNFTDKIIRMIIDDDITTDEILNFISDKVNEIRSEKEKNV